jgi:hypothetical protein
VQSLDYYCRCRRRREPLCAHIKLVGARRRRSQCILYPSCGVRMHADERRELKHNHYGNALRNENSRALHFILYPRPVLSMHTCRICALIYTQANKSRMNFFLITRDIKERARLERSLNYYRSTTAFASRCAAGNPLQQSTFLDSRITLSACTVHTLTAAETSRCFKSEELKRRTKVGGSFCYIVYLMSAYTYRHSIYMSFFENYLWIFGLILIHSKQLGQFVCTLYYFQCYHSRLHCRSFKI